MKNYAPQAFSGRLIGTEKAGVDEQDRNGRKHNRPVPFKRGVPNQGVDKGAIR